MVKYGMVWERPGRYGMVWYGEVYGGGDQAGMVWYGMVRYMVGEIRPVWPSAIVGKKVTRGAQADQHI